MLVRCKKNRKGKRFNLLMLEEKDYYVEDAAAFAHVAAEDFRQNNNNTQTGAGGRGGGGGGGGVSGGLKFHDREKIRGRIHICTKSLYFDPDETRYPVLRIPLREIVHLRARSDPVDHISVVTKVLVEIHHAVPYNFKVLNPLADPKAEICFSLPYSDTAAYFNIINRLFMIDRLEATKRVDAIKKFVEERESKIAFDTSWYADLQEKPLLQSAERCLQVTPLVSCAGCMMVTNNVIYFQPFNHVTAEPVYKYPISEIRRVYKRRYLMREVAIEIYFSPQSKSKSSFDSSFSSDNDMRVPSIAQDSAYFSFRSTETREKIYNLIVSQKAFVAQAQYSLESMTELWRSGQISNFEYLMFVNEEAGRSFQDLTQYPVFPWVISDYASTTLDVQNPATFRDLTKPIGALNPKRLEIFRKRMAETTEDIHKGRPFLYGTHYSTPGYVLYFLVRKAPEFMLRLQNGKFDHPDRLFTSISGTWNSCLEASTDLKELIPEFYHAEDPDCGEWLRNDSGLDLGVRHNGKEVEDVELPRWAKSPRDFILKCRKALESEYVSKNLHHWIDLIFGYKQQGPDAAKADNLFFYLTYEGAVDIETVTDPQERASLEAQISEFGQTPRRIFNRPHPQRGGPSPSPPKVVATTKSTSQTTSSQQLATDSGPSQKSTSSSSTSSGSSGSTITTGNTLPNASVIPMQDEMFVFKPHTDISLWQEVESIEIKELSLDLGPLPLQVSMSSTESTSGHGGNSWQTAFGKLKCTEKINIHRDSMTAVILSPDEANLYSASADGCLKVYSLTEKKQRRSTSVSKLAISSCCLTPRGESIIAGSWNNHVYLYSIGFGGVLCDVVAHDDAVSCVDIQGTTFASASWDGTVKVWGIREGEISRQPLMYFGEHDTAVRAVAFAPAGGGGSSKQSNGNILVSGSDDGTIIFYDIRMRNVIRSIQGSYDLSCLSFFPQGDSFVCAAKDGSVKRFTLAAGGKAVSMYDCGDEVSCLKCNDDFVLTGGSSGILRLWDARHETASPLAVIDMQNGPITCMDVATDGKKIICGFKEKKENLALWAL